MTDELEILRKQRDEAIYHLLWVWFQYAGFEQDGDQFLKALCMSAGEDAAEFLEKFGTVEYDSWYPKITPAGSALMDSDGEPVLGLNPV